MLRRALALCAILAAGCPRPPPVVVKQPPPPPPEVHVPAGCEADLSGAWIHARTPGWRYQVADDGGSLEVDVWRGLVHEVDADDGGARDAGRSTSAGKVSDAGPASASSLPPGAGQRLADGGSALDAGRPGPLPHAHLQLLRTEHGFQGTSHGEVALRDGTVCPLVLPVEIIACRDGGLTLRAPVAATLDAQCQAPPGTKSPDWLEHPLTRADAGEDFR